MGGDAAKHKIDEKRANSEAKKSGPVGKAVNGVKSRRPSAPAGSSTV